MHNFSLLIAKWYRQNKRDLPWRNTSDPYKIWLSEIIMQQTRVEQGISYYLKFCKNYPTVIDLANAEEIEILNDWQGLGYYSRARNLHFSAQLIRDESNGKFPTSFDEIKKLKGVGVYTASAIASFAFNESKAVVDGNVYRLLSRCFDVDLAIDSTEGIKFFQALADELLDSENPGEHNQAMMEMGANVCSPKPKCDNCPLNHGCEALKNHTISDRPVKSKKTKVTQRFFHFLVYSDNSETLIEKREGKGIWQNMYQFPLIETSSKKTKELISILKNQVNESEEIVHLLSHQKIHAVFHHFNELPPAIEGNWIKIPIGQLQNYPLPRIIDRYLESTAL
ncbi:MAG: A/G-specific adenine glycosylase [Crocinitomicaceae bacterium]|nr:A/G-specific adenine glycosylase [Crocinitomicaceae bacterium]